MDIGTRIDYVRVDTHRDNQSMHIIWNMMIRDQEEFAPLAKVSGDKK